MIFGRDKEEKELKKAQKELKKAQKKKEQEEAAAEFQEQMRKQQEEEDAIKEKVEKLCKEMQERELVIQGYPSRHFRVLIDNLMPDEVVHVAFIGKILEDDDERTEDEVVDDCAFAVTNKRLLLGQNRIIGEFTKSISVENINDVSMNKKFLSSYIVIDNTEEEIKFTVTLIDDKKIIDALNEAIYKAKSKSTQQPITAGISSAEQLLKLKELLDANLLTQEEFEKEKAKILN